MSLNWTLGDCLRVRSCSADKTANYWLATRLVLMKQERSESNPSQLAENEKKQQNTDFI